MAAKVGEDPFDECGIDRGELRTPWPRRLGAVDRVRCDHPPADGLTEGLVQDEVQVQDRTGGELSDFSLEQARVQVLEIERLERGQIQVTDRRQRVETDQAFVPLPRSGSNTASSVRQPLDEVVVDGLRWIRDPGRHGRDTSSGSGDPAR